MHNASTSVRWFTRQQTADYLGCSVRQIQLLTKQGRLPVSYALGERSPRYDRLAIDDRMAAQQPQQKSPAVNSSVRLVAG
jgi:hypothetical protein